MVKSLATGEFGLLIDRFHTNECPLSVGSDTASLKLSAHKCFCHPVAKPYIRNKIKTKTMITKREKRSKNHSFIASTLILKLKICQQPQ
jgi:hypothetical protein